MNNKRTAALRSDFNARLDKIVDALRSRATEQFNYSLETNVPMGILKEDEVVENALFRGIISGAQVEIRWGVEPTIQLAHDLLEDSNCHTEARRLTLV